MSNTKSSRIAFLLTGAFFGLCVASVWWRKKHPPVLIVKMLGVRAGGDISTAAEELCEFAAECGEPVTMEFNGVELTARPEDHRFLVEDNYFAALLAREEAAKTPAAS